MAKLKWRGGGEDKNNWPMVAHAARKGGGGRYWIKRLPNGLGPPSFAVEYIICTVSNWRGSLWEEQKLICGTRSYVCSTMEDAMRFAQADNDARAAQSHELAAK